MGSFPVNLGYNGTTDPRAMAPNQRQMLWNYGGYLNDQAQQQAGYAGGQADYYQQGLNNALGPMVQGTGGYNPVEQGAIMGTYGQDGVPGLSDIGTTQDQFQSNYLTPDEQSAIAGNPNYGGYFDPQGMAQTQDDSSQFQRQAYQQLQGNLNNAIVPSNLQQSQGYLNDTNQTLQNNQNTTMAAIGGEANNVRGAINPAQLQQSGAAANTVNQDINASLMTPQQQQDIVTGAGISAGIRNQAAVGDLQRQTLAAGGNPAAVADYRARMGVQSAAEAGDAMTQARIQASNAAAQRSQTAAGLTQGLEQQRLGSQQYLTGEQAGTELSMGNQAVGAIQQLGQQQLGQENTQEQQRLAANQYLTGAQMQGATIGGEAAIGGEQAINAQQRQSQQFNTQTGTGILQAQDAAAAARAQALAQNRQGINIYGQQTQYGQGLTANQLGSQRAAQVANTRLGQQQYGLGMYGNLYGQANTNQQNAYNRQQQTYGTTATGTNAASATGVAASAIPSIGTRIGTSIIGGLTGGIGQAAKAGGFGEKGMVVTEPTVAVLGEDGPEKVEPLTYKPDAAVRPDVTFGKEQMRRRRPMYGQQQAA